MRLIILMMFFALGAEAQSTIDTTVVVNINYTCEGCPPSGGGCCDIRHETSSVITVNDAYDIYIFTGATNTTWTLATISTVIKNILFIQNVGTAELTLDGTDEILNSDPFIVYPGIGYTLLKGSTKWILQ